MDVFVLPSINEGISNTILEAMATGLPVVAGNIGGNPELVVDGLTGALYANGGQSGLREALVRYVTDAETRKAHGAAGRAHVVQNFSLERMIERYASLYDSVLGQDWPPMQIASEAAVTKRGQQP